MYSIPDLETFVTVAKNNGVTAASRHLGISAATTSHRISKLEKALKVTLFHRNSRTFRLSDEGRIFLEKVEVILSDLRQAELDAGSGTSHLRGHLRVTMSPWILSRFIFPVLGEFRRENPELTIEFLTVDRFVSLTNEGQDCAVRVGKLADSALVARKLCDNERVICGAPDLLNRTGTPETIDDLANAEWVSLPWQRNIDVTDAAGRKRLLKLPRNLELSNSDMLTEGAVHGHGLAVKSRLAIKHELDTGTLVEVMPGRLYDPEAPITFIFSPESRAGRKTEAFGKLAKKAFSKIQD